MELWRPVLMQRLQQREFLTICGHYSSRLIPRSTHLSMSQEISPSVEAIASLESHINYFLRLLSQEHAVYDEAPWVTVFAFKAALIGWQLVSAECWKPAEIIGTGDKWDMYQWMNVVFERRKNWCIGRLVTNSLKELDDAT